MTEVSIVLPAYNEAARLEETVKRTIDAVKQITDSFEIVIAEDGSDDGTDRIATALAEAYPCVEHLHSDERLGRGAALNRALKHSKGEVLAYIDVDLATEMNYLKDLIDAVRVEGFDFATGSRMMPESDVERPFNRSIASKGFNLFTRTLLHSRLYDHQCGFKSFRREPLFELVDDIEDKHWFWDTELLVLAQERGYRVKEFPVAWKHGGATKVNIVRDIFGMGRQILRMWWRRAHR
ncbi:glycosyltransferase family 2 protein [Methanosarcinales archaeon]|nr:MAG: glycosyltransferase family 2 protein [Methanosarcinales archaeon]HHI30264.1 glycosyltransferase family 2 protein [Candidatus Methanoperedenaceae archaeon]